MRFILAVAVAGLLCFDIVMVFGDIGTATRCAGYDQEQFPEGGLFAAASDGVWNNGAACGRRYGVKCISGQRKPCKGGFIVIQVVDVCRTNPSQATLTLSNKAFNAISRNIPNCKINVDILRSKSTIPSRTTQLPAPPPPGQGWFLYKNIRPIDPKDSFRLVLTCARTD